MWNYDWGDWRQANSNRAHVGWRIWGNIRADDSYRGGPDLWENAVLRGDWGDGIHFWIYCFILWVQSWQPGCVWHMRAPCPPHAKDPAAGASPASVRRAPVKQPLLQLENDTAHKGSVVGLICALIATGFPHTCTHTCERFCWNFDFTISLPFVFFRVECLIGWNRELIRTNSGVTLWHFETHSLRSVPCFPGRSVFFRVAVKCIRLLGTLTGPEISLVSP